MADCICDFGIGHPLMKGHAKYCVEYQTLKPRIKELEDAINAYADNISLETFKALLNTVGK